MERTYENIDLCLDCHDTQCCTDAVIEHDPELEDSGNYAVIKCSRFELYGGV